jgi:hypothetical protein
VEQTFRAGDAKAVGGALAALRAALEVVGERPEAEVRASRGASLSLSAHLP